MHFLYDHLSAGIVGAAVLLIFVGMQVRMTEINIEQTASYMVKKQAIDLATWMEEDLLRMGQYVDREVEVFFKNPNDSSGMTKMFEFHYVDEDGDKIEVRYQLLQVGTRAVGDTTLTIFRLRRRTKRPLGGWQNDGESAGLLTSYRIQMLNRDGHPIANPANMAAANPDTVRNTRVRFALATPFETSRTTLRQVYYGSTLLIHD
jgi:hypothetical protein